MTIKKILIFNFIFVFVLLIIVMTNVSFHVDLSKYHDYYTISEFEKETEMTFYDIYDFESYISRDQKILLSEIDNIRISTNDYEDLEYFIYFDNDMYSLYDFDFEFIKELTTRDYQIEQVNDYSLYIHEEGSTMYFIVIKDTFQYQFTYENTKGLENSYITEKAKEYVQLNAHYHNQ